MPETVPVTEIAGVEKRKAVGRGWIVGGIGVATALALALGYSLWWTKPNAFGGTGNGFGFEQTIETMHPVTVNMVDRSIRADSETITVSDVVPRVVANTADALITVAVCQVPSMPFLSVAGPASDACEAVTDVEGQEVRLTADGSTTITMTLTPQRRGRVVIEGMEVGYVRGSGHLWQRGSQVTGPVVTLRVTR